MNTRCYRCGNSFSLSREVVEGAVAAAEPEDKVYVAYCPRCRTANKVPLQQLRRTLPAGWTPPAAAAAVTEAAAPAPEPAPEPPAAVEAAAPAKTTRKRASKSPEAAEAASPEATPAAKKASRSKAKPSA